MAARRQLSFSDARARCARSKDSELLDPRPDLDLPAPGAAMLLHRGPVGLGDGVGIEQAVGIVPGTGRAALRMPPSITKCATWMPLGLSSRAIDCASPRRANLPMAKVADSAKPFTPAVAPDSRIAPWSLGSMRLAACWETRKAAEGADLDGALHLVGRQVDQRAAHPGAGVVDHDIGRARLGLDRLEQRGNILRIGGVAFMDGGARLAGQRRELVGLAGGDGNGEPVPGEQARERGAEPGPGARQSAQSGISACPSAVPRCLGGKAGIG